MSKNQKYAFPSSIKSSRSISKGFFLALFLICVFVVSKHCLQASLELLQYHKYLSSSSSVELNYKSKIVINK